MASGKCMIIGLGDIGLQLVRSLSRNISLICVDTSPELLEVARQLRSEGLETFQGDATSRLVLEKAGVRQVDTILLTTTSERQGRAIDKDAGGAGMEVKKQQGYF